MHKYLFSCLQFLLFSSHAVSFYFVYVFTYLSLVCSCAILFLKSLLYFLSLSFFFVGLCILLVAFWHDETRWKTSPPLLETLLSVAPPGVRWRPLSVSPGASAAPPHHCDRPTAARRGSSQVHNPLAVSVDSLDCLSHYEILKHCCASGSHTDFRSVLSHNLWPRLFKHFCPALFLLPDI